MRPLFGLLFYLTSSFTPLFFNYDYTEEAIKIFENASLLQGSQNIEDYYKKNPITTDSTWSSFTIAGNQKFNYEVGGFTFNEETYKHLLITTNEENPKRVLEFIAKVNDTKGSKSEIDAMRKKWMELCNAHNVEGLVRQVYAEKQVYYNHKPAVTDPEALIKEYGYMAHPKYSLKLKPEYFEFVRSDLAFEIGQCSGGYNGKYILIWRKYGDDWRVLLDSNI